MTKDLSIFTGPLISGDQVMNLVIYPGKHIDKDGKVINKEEDQYFYIRGEDVTFVTLNPETAEKRVDDFDPTNPDKDVDQ